VSEKPPKYLFDGETKGHYVRAWREGTGRNAEIVVQVWKDKTTPDGEPDGDWGMPKVLGVDFSIKQAIAQTHSALKQDGTT
jgi:hypothetical protein